MRGGGSLGALRPWAVTECEEILREWERRRERELERSGGGG